MAPQTDGIDRQALIEALERRRRADVGDEGFEHVQRAAENLISTAGETTALIPQGAGIVGEGVGGQLQHLAERAELLRFLDPVGKHLEIGGKLSRIAGDVLKEKSAVRSLPGEGNVLTETVASGVGSSLPFLATGGLGGAAAGAIGAGRLGAYAMVAGQGALMKGAQEFMEAELAGEDYETRWKSFFAGAGTGWPEAVPIGGMASRLARIDKRSGGSLSRAVEVLLEGGEEAAQEWFDTVSSNAIAKHIRDEDRDYFADAAEAAEGGGMTGLLLSFLIPGRQGPDTVERDQRIELEAVPYEPEEPAVPMGSERRLGRGGEVGFPRRQFGQRSPKQLEAEPQPVAEERPLGVEPTSLPPALRSIAGLLPAPQEAEAEAAPQKVHEKPQEAAAPEATQEPPEEKVQETAAQGVSEEFEPVGGGQQAASQEGMPHERLMTSDERALVSRWHSAPEGIVQRVGRKWDSGVPGAGTFRTKKEAREYLDRYVTEALPRSLEMRSEVGPSEEEKRRAREIRERAGLEPAPELEAASQEEFLKLPTEEGLYGEQERPPKPRKEGAALSGSQGLLIDEQEGDQPGQQTITDLTDALKGREAAPEKKRTQKERIADLKAGEGTLQEFVRGMGGLRFQADLERLTEEEIGKKRRPGFGRLVHREGSERGVSMDDAIEAATEAGYFPGREIGDVTPAEFLDALEDNLPSEAQLERLAIQEEAEMERRPLTWADVLEIDPRRRLNDVPFDRFDPAEFEQQEREGRIPDDDIFYAGVVLPQVPKSWRNFLRRNFRSRGHLPDHAFDAKLVRDAQVQRDLEQAKLLVKDFDRQVRKDYGKKPSMETVRMLDKVFKGEADPEQLSPDLREIVRQMREHVDRLSRRGIEVGAFEGPLAARIAENVGFYATRTYKVFEDPKWAEKVPLEVRNKFKALLLEGYILPERAEEIRRRFNRSAERAVARAEATLRQRRKAITLESTAELEQLLRDTKRANQIVEKVAGALDPIQGLERMEAGLEGLSKHAEANIKRITGRMARQLAKAQRAFQASEARTYQRTAERIADRIALESMPQVETEKDAEKLIELILHDGKAADNPIAFLARGSKLGSKDLSILKRRKGLPPELRALLGENVNARTNYANSVIKMANLVANHQFLRQVRKDGHGVFLWEDPGPLQRRVNGLRQRIEKAAEKGRETDAMEEELATLEARLEVARSRPKEAKKRFATEGSKTLEPLNGYLTTPEVAQAFEDFIGEHPIDQAWLRAWLRASGYTKLGKTVGSPMTHIRNLMGNTGFAIANGHWRVGKARNAWKGILGGIRSKSPREWRDYWLRAVELGVVQESTHAGEVRDIAKDAEVAGPQKFLRDAVERNMARDVGGAARGVLEGTTRLYQAEDDVWKLYAWENEKVRYRKARPDLSEAEIEQLTARIVADTYPTYSRVPRAIRALRRFPLVGNFVSFPAEVVRVLGNTIKLTQQELADSRTRGIGMQRAAGLMLAMSVPSALAFALRAIIGITDEEDEDFRVFLPPWSRNSTILHLGGGEYIDFSYTDPYSYVKKPLKALMRGGDWEEQILGETGAVREFLEPFIGEEILTQAVIDVTRNKKQTGGDVYKEAEPWEQKGIKIAQHLAEAFEPGLSSQMRRVAKGIGGEVEVYGKRYDPVVDALAMMTGIRRSRLDLRQAVSFIGRDYDFARRDATSVLSDVAKQSGAVSDAELIEAYEDSELIRRQAFEKARSAASVARSLGFSEEETFEALSSVLPDSRAERILRGVYEPYVPGSSWMRQTIQRAPEDLRDLLEHRRSVVMEYARRQEPK